MGQILLPQLIIFAIPIAMIIRQRNKLGNFYEPCLSSHSEDLTVSTSTQPLQKQSQFLSATKPRTWAIWWKQRSPQLIALLLMGIALVLLLIRFFDIKHPEERLTIRAPSGERITLPYLNSDLLKPEAIVEPPLTLITFRNLSKILQVAGRIVTKEDKVGFAAQLFMNWLEENRTLYRIQYLHLNMTYNLDRYIPQRRICVLAPFRNLLKYGLDGSFKIFLKSLNGQNYSNFRVYMIDDASTDASTQVILSQLHQYPRLNNRIRIIKNKQKIGALGNRDSTTRNYCRSGDIVMDIDGDDALVGKQVFNLFNRLYHDNPQAWFIYTNFISIKGEEGGDGRVVSLNISRVRSGPCRRIHQKYLLSNSYRTEVSEWVTSELRSYLWDLYMKIPLNYVLEIDTGRYYIEASDRFTMYALTELANLQHTFYFEEFSYFYYEPNFNALSNLNCTLPILFYCEAQARILTPLMPLQSLGDRVQVTQFYSIPIQILEFYISSKQKMLLCQQKTGGNPDLVESVEQA